MSLLLDQGADIEARDEDGHTALMWASQEGQFDAVRLLVERKANLHARDASKDTGTDASNQKHKQSVVGSFFPSLQNVLLFFHQNTRTNRHAYHELHVSIDTSNIILLH